MRKNAQKTWVMWAFIILGFLFIAQVYQSQSHTVIKDFKYPEFRKALDAGQISKVTMHLDSSQISGEIKPEFKKDFKNAHVFKFDSDTSSDMRELIEAKGVVPNQVTNQNSFFSNIAGWLPLIVMVLIFMFMFKQLQAGGGKAMSFGKSKAKLLTANKKKVTFKDVAGVDEAKQDLEEVVEFLKNPKKFTRLGGRIPKGVLLIGSPGTGKTLLARAVAGEANVPFYTISGSDFVEMFVGVGASRVRDLFEQGKKNAPCLIFIDEIDAVGRHRGAGMGGGHDEREQTLNQLLVEMDGFEGNDGVILIAATNRPDVLDPALLRPGRFDRRVIVNKPDLKGRHKILEVHTGKTPLSKNVVLDKIARGTPGFSGADIENLVNEAALMAARSNKNVLEMSDFELAKDKVLMGAERRSMMISDEDKKITAYHEAGHTIVGRLLPGMDPIHKVSIIPRGRALGVTQTLPQEDQLNLSVSKAKNTIAFMFGGRAAEEIIFKDFTTGASNDIERATDLARSMVCEWGMSEKIGPLALEKGSGPVFLGMQGNDSPRTYSESKAEEVDAEIKSLVQEGRETAMRLLNENMKVLHTMSEALLEYETIDGAEVDLLIDGATLEDLTKKRGILADQLEKEQAQAAVKAQAEKEEKKEEDDNGGLGDPDPLTV